jgi:thioredoxin 1
MSLSLHGVVQEKSILLLTLLPEHDLMNCMSTVELTKDNFRDVYQQNDLLVVIFRADWCGPCQSFKPTYEKVAASVPGVVFGTVDIDAEPEIAAYFSIRSVPFVVVVRAEVELYAEPGALSEDQLKDLIQRAQKLDMDEVKKTIPSE